MDNYAILKQRIILSSLKFGFVFAVILSVAYDIETALIYSLGVSSGAAYLYLLGVNVDSIGAKYSATGLIPTNGTVTAPGK
jgi:hypothetical protein